MFGNEIEWKKVRVKNGVTVYKTVLKDQVAFRGVKEMKGNPEDLVAIIENPDGWNNWIESFKSGKLIEQVSADHKVFYQAIHSPFPVSDRDVVYESKIFRDQPGIIRIEMKSVTHPKAPKTIGVRIKILFTRYIIKESNDNLMLVTFETSSVPGGKLPDFLVNWASESYPVTLLSGLAKQLESLNLKNK